MLGFKLLDVDKDGDLDLLGLGWRGDVVTLANDGHGQFTGGASARSDSIGGDFVLGDLNEDGRRDLVRYVHPRGFPKHPRVKVGVRFGDAKGGFGKEHVLDTGVALPRAPPPPPDPKPGSDVVTGREGVPGTGSVAIGDLDRDGHLDLAVTQTEATGVALLRGNGRGAFAKVVRVGTGIRNPGKAIIATFSGDRTPDLVVLERNSNHIVVLFAKRQGGYEKPWRYRAAREVVGDLIAADLDTDRQTDLAVTDPNRNDVGVLHGRPLAIPR